MEGSRALRFLLRMLPGATPSPEQSPHTGAPFGQPEREGERRAGEGGERFYRVAPLPPGLSDDVTSEAPPFKAKQVEPPPLTVWGSASQARKWKGQAGTAPGNIPAKLSTYSIA